MTNLTAVMFSDWGCLANFYRIMVSLKILSNFPDASLNKRQMTKRTHLHLKILRICLTRFRSRWRFSNTLTPRN